MSWDIRPATAADGEAILDLVRRTPQQGRVLLNFERDPDFFAGAHISCEVPEVWVAGRGDGLAAVFNIGRRAVFVNGEERQVRYAHDLRIAPDARGGLLLHRMFRVLRRELAPGEWMQTVILAGNRDSMGSVGSGRAGLPTYYPFGEIETSLLATASAPAAAGVPGLHVAPATAADLPDLQQFLDREGPRRQFFPRHRLDALSAGDPYYAGLASGDFMLAWRGTRVVGVLGIWDQSPFRRTRVLAYPGAVRILRPLLNLLGPVTGGLRLPPEGQSFRYRTLHTLLVQDDDPAVFRLLLQRQLEAQRGRCDALVLGMFVGDPLRPVLRGFRRRTLASRHFLVSYDGDPRPALDPRRLPAIEIARL